MNRAETKSERWNLRVTPSQASIVQAALAGSGESLNDFVARAAVSAAEDALADRRAFVLDEDAWVKLDKLLRKPPRRIPELAKLMNESSVLD